MKSLCRLTALKMYASKFRMNTLRLHVFCLAVYENHLNLEKKKVKFIFDRVVRTEGWIWVFLFCLLHIALKTLFFLGFMLGLRSTIYWNKWPFMSNLVNQSREIIYNKEKGDIYMCFWLLFRFQVVSFWPSDPQNW